MQFLEGGFPYWHISGMKAGSVPVAVRAGLALRLRVEGWVDIPVGIGARFRFGRAEALHVPLLGPQLLEVLI